MDLTARIGAAYSSFTGHLILGILLFAGLSANWCGGLDCRRGRIFTIVDPIEPQWVPWLDTITDRRPGADEDAPRCPAASAAAKTIRLEDAPLPAGYDPAGTRVGRLVACIRLDHRARVVSAFLLPRNERLPLKGAILREIRNEWHFVAAGRDPAGWQGVRLYQEPTAAPGPPLLCGRLDGRPVGQECAPVRHIVPVD